MCIFTIYKNNYLAFSKNECNTSLSNEVLRVIIHTVSQ